MSFLGDLKNEPWRFDFFATLRRLERSHKERPRIGESASLREEYVALGQDPYLEFPASNLARVEEKADGRLQVLVKFLGLLGPQGALPLATTEEAQSWVLMRDDAFPRFLDLLNNRFLQLFFRSWADARPISQHDRPGEDRFVAYVGTMIGIGSPLYLGLDTIPDSGKLEFAGLMAPQAKSASRLRNLIRGLFRVEVEIHEFIGSYLQLDAADRTAIGQKNSALGADILVGSSVFSVQDKIRIRIYAKNMAEYTQFLPTGGRCEPLADIVFFYIGDQLDWEIELAIPTRAVEPVRLSKFGQLGWTSWVSPRVAEAEEGYRCDARFHPAERMKQKREQRSEPFKGDERWPTSASKQ
jgi:type VI secretion system protein ImpH